MKARIRRASVDAMKGAFHESKTPQETAWAMLINRNAAKEIVKILLFDLRLWGPRALVEARPEDLLDLLSHVPNDLNRDAILELLCEIPEKGDVLRDMVDMHERLHENQVIASGIEEGQGGAALPSRSSFMTGIIARGRKSIFSSSTSSGIGVGGNASPRTRSRLQTLGNLRRRRYDIFDSDSADSEPENASTALNHNHEINAEAANEQETVLFGGFWNPFDTLAASIPIPMPLWPLMDPHTDQQINASSSSFSPQSEGNAEAMAESLEGTQVSNSSNSDNDVYMQRIEENNSDVPIR